MTPIAEGLLERYCDKTPSTSEDISRSGCTFAQGNGKTMWEKVFLSVQEGLSLL